MLDEVTDVLVIRAGQRRRAYREVMAWVDLRSRSSLLDPVDDRRTMPALQDPVGC